MNMPIQEELLNQIKCCLGIDGHICIKPIVFECGGNACKDCVNEADIELIKCYNCNQEHEKKDLTRAPLNKLAETLIKLNLTDLFKYVDHKLANATGYLTEESLIEEINKKISFVENDMDLRVESLITEIHQIRDEYRLKLKKFKGDFEKKLKQDDYFIQKNVVLNIENTIENLQKKQNELKRFNLKIQEYKQRLNQIEFQPSEFDFQNECFGELVTDSIILFEKESWLNNSLILNKEEISAITAMTNSTSGVLLYRATRDGFTAQAFHSKCDGKPNTITIIKNNFNFVFGGFIAASRTDTGAWIEDPAAFIFSLRRNGVSNAEMFLVKNPKYAVDGSRGYGPIFGEDIVIRDKSNIKTGSYSDLGNKYNIEGINTDDPKSYLAGNRNNWLTTEIEVYEIKNL